MLEYSSAVVIGFALLVWGADRFVVGAAATARNLGVSPLVIGLTIVGFGTSAPEMLVSGVASLQGNTGLAIGNAIGSNIANIALILGAAALVSPLTVRSETLRREYPALLAISLLSVALLLDGQLGRADGLILLTGLAVMLYWVVWLGLRSRSSDPITKEFEAGLPAEMGSATAAIWLVVGLIVLLVSSRMLVWGAVNIALTFGVSDLVIGLTILAIGTSLPELAASIASTIKGEDDIAIGNIIGSNMYNLLAVLAIPGLIQPGTIPPEVLTRDIPVMIGLTLALFVMGYGLRGRGRINRLEGGILLLTFCGYQLFLFLGATTAA